MQDKGAHKDSQETTATPDQLDGSQDHPVQEETDMDPKDQDQQVQEAHTTFWYKKLRHRLLGK